MLFATMSDDSDDDIDMQNVLIFTQDEVLMNGLSMLGWKETRLNFARRTDEKNIEQHKAAHGLHPAAVAQLAEDLQTTKIQSARVERLDIDKLHWCLHFLYRYPRENERENTWHKCRNTIRVACWYYVKKIRNLKWMKIVWPKFKPSDVWVMTVDGTHLVTLEPGDSDVPKDPAYFSFKHHSAGFNYEVGIDLFTSKCIWLSGPHKAGTYNDAKIFKEKGLRSKLRKHGKKAIADEGYRGFPGEISTANSLDSAAVAEFKVRARQRHEIYNGKLKQFEILSDRFRCKNNPKDELTVAEKLQMCFEAVNVLVAYKMEFGEPLYDI